jgi:hypothetical protein
VDNGGNGMAVVQELLTLDNPVNAISLTIAAPIP